MKKEMKVKPRKVKIKRDFAEKNDKKSTRPIQVDHYVQ